MSKTVDIPEELKQALRKFRFGRCNSSAAMVVKIDKKQLKMVEDETYDDISIDDLAQELPENAPRYVVLSYELKYVDGRKNYPLVLVNWSPTGSETSLLTLHASALIDFQNTVDVQKVIEIRDGAEGLTKEAIEAKLKSTF
ncbi:hypothetical protein ACEPAF_4445 [Sanghuangporus sanghuang]|uniref:Glia maturation factor beta n=1 Tax=Sanghuangporus baumii TaxID=108892 RepID=A0A9Q5I1C1_SANBA|nr:glia maturation factor beta [Sanghuangporus baumii]